MKRDIAQVAPIVNGASDRLARRAGLSLPAILAASFLAAPALAQDTRQFNNPGVGDWATAANWTPAQLPAASTNAYIDNGGTAQVTAAGAQGRFVYLGSAAGKSGNLEISAPGELTALNMLVATGGSGALSIADGGLLNSAASAVGGPTVIQGAGSKWTLTGTLAVSGPVNATFNVRDGGEYAGALGGLQVGQGSGNHGVVFVDGPTSKFASGGVFLGYLNGVAEFTVRNGATATSFDVDIAQSGSGAGRSTGAATVTGAGSRWTLTSDARVGVVGDGLGFVVGEDDTLLPRRFDERPSHFKHSLELVGHQPRRTVVVVEQSGMVKSFNRSSARSCAAKSDASRPDCGNG